MKLYIALLSTLSTFATAAAAAAAYPTTNLSTLYAHIYERDNPCSNSGSLYPVVDGNGVIRYDCTRPISTLQTFNITRPFLGRTAVLRFRITRNIPEMGMRVRIYSTPLSDTPVQGELYRNYTPSRDAELALFDVQVGNATAAPGSPDGWRNVRLRSTIGPQRFEVVGVQGEREGKDTSLRYLMPGEGLFLEVGKGY